MFAWVFSHLPLEDGSLRICSFCKQVILAATPQSWLLKTLRRTLTKSIAPRCTWTLYNIARSHSFVCIVVHTPLTQKRQRSRWTRQGNPSRSRQRKKKAGKMEIAESGRSKGSCSRGATCSFKHDDQQRGNGKGRKRGRNNSPSRSLRRQAWAEKSALLA